MNVHSISWKSPSFFGDIILFSHTSRFYCNQHFPAYFVNLPFLPVVWFVSFVMLYFATCIFWNTRVNTLSLNYLPLFFVNSTHKNNTRAISTVFFLPVNMQSYFFFSKYTVATKKNARGRISAAGPTPSPYRSPTDRRCWPAACLSVAPQETFADLSWKYVWKCETWFNKTSIKTWKSRSFFEYILSLSFLNVFPPTGWSGSSSSEKEIKIIIRNNGGKHYNCL